MTGFEKGAVERRKRRQTEHAMRVVGSLMQCVHSWQRLRDGAQVVDGEGRCHHVRVVAVAGDVAVLPADDADVVPAEVALAVVVVVYATAASRRFDDATHGRPVLSGLSCAHVVAVDAVLQPARATVVPPFASARARFQVT